MTDRLCYGIQFHFFTAYEDLSADPGSVAFSEYTHGKLGTSRAHQSGNSHNLSFTHIERNVVYNLSFGIKGMMYCPVFYFHGDIADLHARTFRETVCQFTSYHALNDTGFGDIVFFFVQCFDGGSIADDCDLIRHVGNLVELMGDDDRSHSLFLELQKKVKKRSGIIFVQ